MTLHNTAARLSKSARSRLLAHSWPGNVRELKNVLDVAATLAEGREIGAQELDLPQHDEPKKGDYHQLIEQYRKDLITQALAQTRGNQAAAARRLGLTRQALSYLVRQLGLS